MRLRVARQNSLDFDGTLVPSKDNLLPQIDEDEWLVKFVKNGSKLAFSSVVSVNSNNEEIEAQKQLEKWLVRGTLILKYIICFNFINVLDDQFIQSLQNDETKSIFFVDNLQNESVEKLNTEYFNFENTVCIPGIWIIFVALMILASTCIIMFLYLSLRNRKWPQKLKKSNSALKCLSIHSLKKKKTEQFRTSSDATSDGDNLSS